MQMRMFSTSCVQKYFISGYLFIIVNFRSIRRYWWNCSIHVAYTWMDGYSRSI